MIKHLLYGLYFFFVTSLLMAQTDVLLSNGKLSVIQNDSLMFIGADVDSLTEEQLYFNPVYLVVQQGKEYLREQLIRASVCDCDTTIPNRRIGVFSVAPGKYVSFSQGNLQYFPAANLWKFADTQYEYLGNANKYVSITYRNWSDLFGWSGENATAPFGVSASANTADYAGNFVDWGINWICGDQPDTWRTMSKEEWEYLLKSRPNANQLKTKGSIDDVKGVILFPDDWVSPAGFTINWVADEDALEANVNAYSVEEWAELEKLGVVFLPAAGAFIHPDIKHTNRFGGYMCSTLKDANNSYIYGFHISPTNYVDYSNHKYGRSVRLVHDTTVFLPEYVDLGLSVRWATCNVGATQPEEYGDYFAWGEIVPKEVYKWETYKWCDATDTLMTKYCSNAKYGVEGFVDSKTILDPEDDAAYINWGVKWRMPTKKEADELINNCTWEIATMNGIKGYLVTSNRPGYTHESIFFPFAGYHNNDTGDGIAGKGSVFRVWTSSGVNTSASNLVNGRIEGNTRRCGFSIRPVCQESVSP